MKVLKYVLFTVAFVIWYVISLTDPISAATEEQSEVCNQTLPPTTANIISLKKDDILISKVMPNPKGKDTGVEWIELKNNSDTAINLLNLVLMINDKKYDFPDTNLSAGQNFHMLSKDLKITLPNKATTLILQDISGTEIHRLQYPDAKDDQIFSNLTPISLALPQQNDHLKLPTSGNESSLLASAGATVLLRLWLKDRIS